MPKNKFASSKKHEYLILKLSDIPTIDDINHCAWSSDLLNGKFTDFRYNTEDALLMIIEAFSLINIKKYSHRYSGGCIFLFKWRL